jgi:hypothetical protein
MRSLTRWSARAQLVLALGFFSAGCATKGVDGSTHFVMCHSDAECSPDQTCSVAGQCGRKSTGPSTDASATGAPTEAGATAHDGEPRRPPEYHRVSASACTAQRGAGTTIAGQCVGGALVTCTQDSDCTAGTNGRCLESAGPACDLYCSYDACSTDADCASNEVCDCRASPSSSDPNVCVPADCHTDAECGSSGFCSPSLARGWCACAAAALCGPSDGTCSPGPCECGDSCRHAYTCHAADDSCVDDSDCNGAPCAYDELAHRWTCHGSCIGP